MEVIEELVLPRVQRENHHEGVPARVQRLFLAQLQALELDGFRARVENLDLELLARRDLQLLRFEHAVVALQPKGE